MSSPQLDVAERGFSYRRDAPLDMRMDPTVGRTGADVVNTSDEDTLVELFADNGETRFARRIARAIIAARPITTTGQLADVVRESHPGGDPAHGRPSGPAGVPGHPHRRQRRAGPVAHRPRRRPGLLRPGGRCVVISYHSGEDRLVKSTFTRAATDDCQLPSGVCRASAVPTRGSAWSTGAPAGPTEAEMTRNRRAEAARLRVIERLPDPTLATTNGEVA